MRKVFDPTLAVATTVHPLRYLTFQGPLITANFLPLQEEGRSHRPRSPGESRTKPSGLSLGEPETYKSLNGIIKRQALSFLNSPKGLGKCSQAKRLRDCASPELAPPTANTLGPRTAPLPNSAACNYNDRRRRQHLAQEDFQGDRQVFGRTQPHERRSKVSSLERGVSPVPKFAGPGAKVK